MCCTPSPPPPLMLRPHGLTGGKAGTDSYPGTPATSFYDPQSPPSARWPTPSFNHQCHRKNWCIKQIIIKIISGQICAFCTILDCRWSCGTFWPLCSLFSLAILDKSWPFWSVQTMLDIVGHIGISGYFGPTWTCWVHIIWPLSVSLVKKGSISTCENLWRMH